MPERQAAELDDTFKDSVLAASREVIRYYLDVRRVIQLALPVEVRAELRLAEAEQHGPGRGLGRGEEIDGAVDHGEQASEQRSVDPVMGHGVELLSQLRAGWPEAGRDGVADMLEDGEVKPLLAAEVVSDQRRVGVGGLSQR